MNNRALVEVVQSRRHFREKPTDLCGSLSIPRPSNVLGKNLNRLSTNQLHAQVGISFVNAELIDPNDVGVIQIGGDPSFVEEHRHELGVLDQVRKDALDDDGVVGGPTLVRQEDLGHSPRGDTPDQSVFSEVLGEFLLRNGQGRKTVSRSHTRGTT